jgi:membrane protease YdiL (CAAX protease family)
VPSFDLDEAQIDQYWPETAAILIMAERASVGNVHPRETSVETRRVMRVGTVKTRESQITNTTRRGLSFGTLGPFFALAFGLTWGIVALLILFPEQIEVIFGELSTTNPLFILAVYSPGIAGVLLVLRHYGLKGLLSFFGRLTLWRMPLAWWVFLVMGIPAFVYVGAAIKGTITDPFPFSSRSAVLSAVAFALIIGPIEEFGWRGVALPLLQRRVAPLWAGLILGVICTFCVNTSCTLLSISCIAWYLHIL